MSRGLLKSSKQKQKLYNKFLKHKTYTNETNYKTCKNLFEKIQKASKKVHYNTIINNANLTEEEFVTAFKSLKSNKATGYDGISSNVIKNIYDEIKIPLMHIFNKSLQKLKSAKVIPVFKSGEESCLNNYKHFPNF